MFIKRPGSRRKSYALVGDDGKTIPDPRIDEINKDLRAGVPKDTLELRLKAVLRSFKPQDTYLISQSNQQLVERCHKAKLLQKHLSDPDSLKSRLTHCAKYAGELSLLECSKEDLYEVVARVSNPSRRFEVIRGLNELLLFANRGFKLKNVRKHQSSRVSFIEVDDFKKKVLTLPVDYQILFGAYIATGCRWGELPLAEIGKKSVFIEEQLCDDGTVGITKNKKQRVSPILPPLLDYVVRYNKFSQEKKNELRLNHYYKCYALCKKVLGIRIHDLRHSYAIAWRKAGATTSQIADYIGDTEEACKKHYLKHGLTVDEIEQAWKLFG